MLYPTLHCIKCVYWGIPRYLFIYTCTSILVRIIDKNICILIYFAVGAVFAYKTLPLQVLFLGPLTLHYVDGVFRIYLGMYNVPVPEPCLFNHIS